MYFFKLMYVFLNVSSRMIFRGKLVFHFPWKPKYMCQRLNAYIEYYIYLLFNMVLYPIFSQELFGKLLFLRFLFCDFVNQYTLNFMQGLISCTSVNLHYAVCYFTNFYMTIKRVFDFLKKDLLLIYFTQMTLTECHSNMNWR